MQINGKELLITPAAFGDAMALQKAIGRALKGTKLELPESMAEKMDASQLGDIIGAVLGVATSDEVEAALFACASRAVYGPGKEPISTEFFEKVENRELYYPIMIEIIKANVGPFFKGLSSKFEGLGQMLGNSRK